MWNIHYKFVVCRVQCSVCSIKCTCAGTGKSAGAGAVCSAHICHIEHLSLKIVFNINMGVKKDYVFFNYIIK